MNKFGAKRTHIDGFDFDSKAEAARFLDLRKRAQAGQIQDLLIHPKYEIWTPKNSWSRPVFYIADFAYIEGKFLIVEDVKGFKTEAYRIKRKMFMDLYPDAIFKEIVNGKENTVKKTGVKK